MSKDPSQLYYVEYLLPKARVSLGFHGTMAEWEAKLVLEHVQADQVKIVNRHPVGVAM